MSNPKGLAVRNVANTNERIEPSGTTMKQTEDLFFTNEVCDEICNTILAGDTDRARSILAASVSHRGVFGLAPSSYQQSDELALSEIYLGLILDATIFGVHMAMTIPQLNNWITLIVKTYADLASKIALILALIISTGSCKESWSNLFTIHFLDLSLNQRNALYTKVMVKELVKYVSSTIGQHIELLTYVISSTQEFEEVKEVVTLLTDTLPSEITGLLPAESVCVAVLSKEEMMNIELEEHKAKAKARSDELDNSLTIAEAEMHLPILTFSIPEPIRPSLSSIFRIPVAGGDSVEVPLKVTYRGGDLLPPPNLLESQPLDVEGYRKKQAELEYSNRILSREEATVIIKASIGRHLAEWESWFVNMVEDEEQQWKDRNSRLQRARTEKEEDKKLLNEMEKGKVANAVKPKAKRNK